MGRGTEKWAYSGSEHSVSSESRTELHNSKIFQEEDLSPHPNIPSPAIGSC